MSGPLDMAFDEIAARLKTAAQVEIGSINHLEFFAAKGDSADILKLTVSEVRRQAQALGLAHQIALALARRPELALGLGLTTDAVTLCDGEGP